jgi:hypothetical protein
MSRPWLTILCECAMRLIQSRVRTISAYGRVFRSSVAAGTPLMQAMVVSLSRNTSLM